MKNKVLGAILASIFTQGLTFPAYGEPIPTSTPVMGAKPTPGSLLTTTPMSPTPTATPLVAPAWAPKSVGYGDAEEQPKKASPWMSSFGLGIGLPRSAHFQTAYTTGFNADIGSGLKVSDTFSLWMDVDLDLFNSQNDSLTQGNNLNLVEASFWAKYRVMDSDLSPYLFAGPGIAYLEYRSDQGAIVDYNTGYGYIPINSYEFDFLVEGGLGLETRMGGGLSAFLQGKLTYVFPSAAFAKYGSTDSPLVVMPFELGLIFGL